MNVLQDEIKRSNNYFTNLHNHFSLIFQNLEMTKDIEIKTFESHWQSKGGKMSKVYRLHILDLSLFSEVLNVDKSKYINSLIAQNELYSAFNMCSANI